MLPANGMVPASAWYQDDAEGVPVGRRVDDVAADLLGGHVRVRPDELVGRPSLVPRGVGDPEIDDHDAPRLRDEDVRRLDVAMDDRGAVERVEPRGELGEGRAKPPLVERPGGQGRRRAGAARLRRVRGSGRRLPADRIGAERAHVLEEVDAADELHREEPLPVVLEELLEADHVRVLEPLERAELVLQKVFHSATGVPFVGSPARSAAGA
jgi:hypothetical protein